MSKNKKNKNWIFGIIIFLVLLTSFLYFSGTIQEQLTFEEGFEPYGESTFSITGLEKAVSVDESGDCVGITTNCKKTYTDDSKYWTFKRLRDVDSGCESYISGNDFNIETGISPDYERCPSVNSRITSKEDFSDKEFKAKVVMKANGGASCRGGSAKFSIPDFRYSQSIDIDDCGSQTKEFNIYTKPSPINDKITLFVNGQEENTIEKSSYNFDLSVSDLYTSGRIILENPRWREQFGCTKEPDEQYYLKVFQEGDVMDMGDFPNWNKFCINQPVGIYTPSGSTTTQEPLLGMVEEDKSYTIPPGQIWTVEYIGDLQSGDTACEQGEVYDLEDEQCIARTAITFDFPGEEEDTTIETDPVVYEREELKTHQGLEEDNKFLFKHIVNDGENTRDSFMIGNDKFISQYEQISEEEGRFKFDYKGTSYVLSEGKSADLSEYLSVSIRDLQDDDDPPGEYNDASITYQFNIDTSFLNTSIDEDSNEIIIQNDYKTFLGGITLTTTDQLDTTTVENIDLLLEKGKTTYQVEGEPREIEVRPYIQIETPEYLYTLEASQGATTDPNFIQQAEDAYRRNPTLGLIIVSVFALIIVGFILLIINNIVNRRK